MEKYGIIYKITNIVTNKEYVGQTIQTMESRFKQHLHDKKYALGAAIKKYGVENFKVEFICNAYSQAELDQMEIFYIDKFNTMSPNGYNIKGGGMKGKLNEQSIRKMSEAKKGKQPYLRTLEIQEKINKSRLAVGAQGQNKTSKYKGVGWDKKNKRWKATVQSVKAGFWAFSNADEVTCAKVRDLYIYKNIDKDGYLNFPDQLLTVDEAIEILKENAHVTNKPNKFLLQLLEERGEKFVPREKCNENKDFQESPYKGVSWSKGMNKWNASVYGSNGDWNYSNKDLITCVRVRDKYVSINGNSKYIHFPNELLTTDECIDILKNTNSNGRNLKNNRFLSQLLKIKEKENERVNNERE